ncbi:hypothetical protein ACIBI8_40125 [Streptomyces sp. NPDC050529]|uniref:hypothetical protein n=1 Tax=Streptomyces sp. NPDC050529 TaxID=3365624 RepID=UPI0037B92066
MPSPRTSAPSTTTGSDALLYLLFGILGGVMAFGSLAWLTGNLTNTFVGSGTWAPFRVTEDAVELRALRAERGEGTSTLEYTRTLIAKLITATETAGIALLPIQRRDEGDFIGYCLLHPEVLWPTLSTSMLMVGVRVVPGLFTVALVVSAAELWMRWRAGSKSGLARKADLAPLLD